MYRAEFEKLYKDAIADKVVNEKEYKSLVSKYQHYKAEKKKLSTSTDFDLNEIYTYASTVPSDFKQEIMEALQSALSSKNLNPAGTLKSTST